MVFPIHWHESAMDLHVLPIPILPPTSLPPDSSVLREQHQNTYIIKGETDHQPRLDAWDKCSGLVHWGGEEFWQGISKGRRPVHETSGFPTNQWVNKPAAMQETQEMWVQSLGQEDPLEEEMATHSSALAWRISWTEEPGRLESMGSQWVGYDWAHIHSTCRLLATLEKGFKHW